MRLKVAVREGEEAVAREGGVQVAERLRLHIIQLKNKSPEA